jgi:hypothetical protein
MVKKARKRCDDLPILQRMRSTIDVGAIELFVAVLLTFARRSSLVLYDTRLWLSEPAHFYASCFSCEPGYTR